MKKIIQQFTQCIIIIFTCVTSAHANHAWEVFGGVGYTNYFTGTQGGQFDALLSETDSLMQSSVKNNAGYILGFDKNIFISNEKQQTISVGLTLHYDPTTFNGEVYQYKSPDANNYTYRYKVTPISALLTGNFFFLQNNRWHLSPFITTGIGLTAVDLNYQETAAKPEISADSARNAAEWQVTSDFAAGAGLNCNFHKNYFIRAQYLYQYRGDVHAGSTELIQGVPVSLDEQSADVILGYRLM